MLSAGLGTARSSSAPMTSSHADLNAGDQAWSEGLRRDARDAWREAAASETSTRIPILGQHHHVLTERHHARADEHEMAGRRYSYPAERKTADTVRESTFSEMSLDRRREALALRQTRAATVDDPWLARLQRRWEESDPAKAGSSHIADSHTAGASHDSQAWRHHRPCALRWRAVQIPRAAQGL